MFTDSLLTPPDDYSRSQHSPDTGDTTDIMSPGHHLTDAKFLTYDTADTDNTSILALAAQSSGIINFDEQEMLSSSGQNDFGMEIDF